MQMLQSDRQSHYIRMLSAQYSSPVVFGLNWLPQAIVLIRRETRSSEENTPIDGFRPSKFSLKSGLKEKKKFFWKSVFFYRFYICLSSLSSKEKVENNSTWFLCAEENLVVSNKDNRVFMSQNYRFDNCLLEIWYSENWHICPWSPNTYFKNRKFPRQKHSMFNYCAVAGGRLHRFLLSLMFRGRF